jgi:hypothetical protein
MFSCNEDVGSVSLRLQPCKTSLCLGVVSWKMLYFLVPYFSSDHLQNSNKQNINIKSLNRKLKLNTYWICYGVRSIFVARQKH